MQTMPLGVLLSALLLGQPADQGTPVERGVVHEAYAQVAQGAPPTDNLLIPRQPPDPLAEEPPDNRPEGDSVTWIAGYWHYDDLRDDFIWVSGFWRQAPPGRRWVPGRFSRLGTGPRWQWQAGYWQAAEAGPAVVVPDSPPPVPEAGPSTPAPAVNMFWSPGCQIWRANRWVWRAGSWMSHRPGWVWYPANWVWTPGGYVFIPGYWDYALEYRGLLYAPVYYQPGVWRARSFCHRPRVLVCQDDLACGLFRRNGCGSYYYGNFFGAQLAGRGFNFWIGVNAGPAVLAGVPHTHRVDPLAGYYRHHREESWVRAVEGYGRQRAEGRQVVPPPQITLVDQRVTNIRNTVVNAGSPVQGKPDGARPKGPMENRPTNPSLPPRGEGVRLVAAQDLPRADLRSRHAPPPRGDSGPAVVREETRKEERMPAKGGERPALDKPVERSAGSRAEAPGVPSSPVAPEGNKAKPVAKSPVPAEKTGVVEKPVETARPPQRPAKLEPPAAAAPSAPKAPPVSAKPANAPAPAAQPIPTPPPAANPGPRQPAAVPVDKRPAETGNSAPRVARGTAPEAGTPASVPATGRRGGEGVERGRPSAPASTKPASSKERREGNAQGGG